MIDVTAAQKAKIDGRCKYRYVARFLKTGLSKFIEDFASGENSLSVSAGGNLPIGNVLSKHLTLNFIDDSNAEDYMNSLLMFGTFIADEEEAFSLEWLYVTSATKEHGLVTIEADSIMGQVDAMFVPPTMADVGHIPTLLDVYTAAVTQIGGIVPTGTTFFNSDLRLQISPRNCKGHTCREVLGWCALLACGNAIFSITEAGYPTAIIHSLGDDTATLNQWITMSVGASVECTGLRHISIIDGQGNEREEPWEHSVGTDGYVFEFDTPLLDGGYATQVLTLMQDRLVGKTFTKFEGSYIANPLVEFGDAVNVTHYGGSFSSFITDITFNLYGASELKCDVPIDEVSVYVNQSNAVNVNQNSINVTNDWQVARLSNGLIIATTEVEVSGLSCTTALGNWYRTAKVTMPSYPSGLFTTAPNVTMQFHSTAGASAILWSTGDGTWTQTDKPDDQYCIRATSGTVTGSIHVCAVGVQN